MVWTIRELAGLAGGRPAKKPDAEVRGFKPAADAGDGDLAFVSSAAWLAKLGPKAAAVVPPDLEKDAGDRPLIVADNPRLAYAKILAVAASEAKPSPGIDERSSVAKTAKLGVGVHVGPFAVVGENAKIGDEVVLHAGAYVGAKAEIGDGSEIFPRAYIGHGCKIGRKVVVGPGSSIGFDGFGYQWDGSRHVKVPQVGIVVLEDEVEIGALVAIDRATLGETRIGAGTKLDNLVMIGHNCKIGRNAIIVSQVGLAGGVEVGDGAILGGQVGVAGGVKIGAGSMVAAKGGVPRDLEPGSRVGGFPARDQSRWLRIEAVVDKLPEMAKRIRRLEKQIEELEKKKG